MAQHRISSLAETDIQEIWLHIASDNLDAADRLVERFTNTFELLAQNPLMGEAQDHVRAGLRRFVVGNYLTFYQPESDGILVVRVLHGSRQWENLL